MSKFVIECPQCGNFAEGRTGFFARKKIDCTCGYTINVRTDKLISRDCPHCGNTVVFDQAQGEKAKCPVCHEPINTLIEQSRYEEFSCGQCGVRLIAGKSVDTYVCPVCDHVNRVQERMMSEKIKRDGLASIIKYEGDEDTIVWKHPIEDFNLGSQLIVHESQEAIFFRDGQALDLFGAGRYTLETQQLPMLEKMYKLPTDTEGTFHSEVYYINLATIMGVKWGTDSKVRMFDPASGLYIEIGACGEFNLHVVNSRKLLIKLVGTSGSLKQSQIISDGQGYFRAMIMTQVKSFLAQSIKESGINILEIDERLMELSAALRLKLNEYLEAYGLEMPEFFVSRVITPDDDPNFKRLKDQYAEQYLLVRQEQIRQKEAEAAAERKAVEAQTEARMKIIGAQGEAEALRIQKQAEADAYRMKAEAEAMEMEIKGFTYQQETSRQVGLEAMKNGLGGSDGGGALGNIAGLGVGLGAMGSVIGMTKEAMEPLANTAGQIGQTMGNTISGTWDCECGNKGIAGNFCPNCGKKRPVRMAAPDKWDCTCGAKGNRGNFCANCGAQKPEAGLEVWNCSCGKTGLTGAFCENCGKKRGDNQ